MATKRLTFKEAVTHADKIGITSEKSDDCSVTLRLKDGSKIVLENNEPPSAWLVTRYRQ